MARLDEHICPYAYGFIPQELSCRLRIDFDSTHISWWRRFWRTLTGYYDCPNEGCLPCKIYEEESK